MQTSTKPAPELLRELNAWHAVAIVAGTIIGSGIFRVPGEMMKDVGSAGLVYMVWIVGGVLSFAGALTYAELGAIKPWAGGEYVYIRDAYGPLPAFLYAWTWFSIAKPASIASVTTGIVDVLGTFPRLSFLAGNIFSFHLGAKTFCCNQRHAGRDCRHDPDFGIKLRRRKKGGCFSTGVYGSKSWDDRCHSIYRVHCFHRKLGQFSYNFPGREGWHGGLYGRAGRSSLGL